MTFKPRTLLYSAIMVIAVFVGMPLAWAMTVQPVVVDLTTTGRGMSQVVTVENTFANPLPVELRIEELAFGEGGVEGTGADPGDLLVFPPQALIPPGQTQAFRVQWVGDPELARSKHYYVTVAQLPVALPEGQSAIQILYNFQVLVSVSPLGVPANLQVVSAEIGTDDMNRIIPIVTMSNDSPAHGYLSHGRLRIVQRDAGGNQIFDRVMTGPEIQQTVGFGLVASGQTRRVPVPVELPAQGGSIEVQYVPEAQR